MPLLREGDFPADKNVYVRLPAYVYDRFSAYFGEPPDHTDLKKRILSNSMLTDLVSYFKRATCPLKADLTSRIVYLNRELRDWDN